MLHIIYIYRSSIFIDIGVHTLLKKKIEDMILLLALEALDYLPLVLPRGDPQ